MKITYGDRLTGRKKQIEDTLYENQLYPSKAGSDKLQALYDPFRFFSQLLVSYLDNDGLIEDRLIQVCSSRSGDNDQKPFVDNLTELINAADVNIGSFIFRKNGFHEKNLPKGMNEIEKRGLLNRVGFHAGTSHKLYNAGTSCLNRYEIVAL